MYCSVKELIAHLSTKNQHAVVLTKLWDTEDIHQVLSDSGREPISEYEAHKALQLVDRTHDAEIGISSETLLCAVESSADVTAEQYAQNCVCFTVPRELYSVCNEVTIPAGSITVEFDAFELRSALATSKLTIAKKHELGGFVKSVSDNCDTPVFHWSVYAECRNGKCTICLQDNFQTKEYRWVEKSQS
ncbi:hypothetical protein ACHCAL_17075 [Providencia huaxiensis]|uniref:hypothetical protein n=1 Tax=Providencia huaxiensis TaxID=2027290 RepID=UPI0037578218